MNIYFSGNHMILEGDLRIDSLPRAEKATLNWLKTVQADDVLVSLDGLESIDSSGVAFLETLPAQAEKYGLSLRLTEPPEAVQKIRDAFTMHEPAPQKTIKIGFFERLGAATYDLGKRTLDLLYLIADTFFFAVASLFKRRGTRKGEFTSQCILIGMNAFPIIALISFLIGFILALQSAAQLRQFGASIYVADLVSISMTREMGPIMTAILFAGRSGSAIAAELATMVVTEETDALRAMGLNPVRYNLVPKFYAITIMMPLLTVLSMVLGILGSMLIGVTYLDIGVLPFYNQVVDALILKDIVTGLIKSVVFSWLILLTAAGYGFHARGGAADVGRATTASVVTSIFLVILADSLLGLLFYFDAGSPI